MAMGYSPALYEGKQLSDAFAYKVFLGLMRSICFALKNKTAKNKTKNQYRGFWS